MPALFDVQDPRERAQASLDQAGGSYRSMMPDVDTTPPKTAGGAVSNAAGGALAGAMYGATKGSLVSPGVGTAIGAGVGLLSYLFS